MAGRSAIPLPMSLRVACLTVDTHDCRRLADFWAACLGWAIVSDTEEGVYVVPRELVGEEQSSVPGLLFFPNTDTKTTKNRVHLDLRPDDQEVEIVRLESLGARRADIGQRGTEPWVVMADPEGNEFCLLAAR